MSNKKIIKFFIKVIGSLLFLWWIVFNVDWSEVWGYLQKISIWQILAYTLAYMGGMIFSSYKWKRLAAHKNINLPFLDFFKSYYAATFINNFMPSFVGGDSFKVYKIGAINNK